MQVSLKKDVTVTCCEKWFMILLGRLCSLQFEILSRALGAVK